jgi:hypothetical protein
MILAARKQVLFMLGKAFSQIPDTDFRDILAILLHVHLANDGYGIVANASLYRQAGKDKREDGCRNRFHGFLSSWNAGTLGVRWGEI